MNQINLRLAKLRELQSAYIVDLFDTWHEKARIAKENERRQSDRPIFNSNINNNLLGTRLNNDGDKKSAFGGQPSYKKEDSIFRGIETSSIGMK